jgi:hypothetical protein
MIILQPIYYTSFHCNLLPLEYPSNIKTMKTSFALLSVTLALGTAVEGSPLNFAALLKRNNDKDYAEAPARSCVQVTSKQAGKCVSPADRQRVSEGTSVTLVDCKDALSWQLPEGKSGPITLCEDSSLVLDAGRDLQDGGRLSVSTMLSMNIAYLSDVAEVYSSTKRTALLSKTSKSTMMALSL